MRVNRPSLFRTNERDDFYHVVLRGGGREPLAACARDRRVLNHLAIDTIQRFDIRLHGYCLLANQLRALIQVDERVLIETLRRIAVRYSRYRRIQSTFPGAAFERPYLAQKVESDSEFLEVLRHIHLSPVTGNHVVSLDDYLWSSHRAYIGYKSNALITTDYGLSLFSQDPSRARAAYHQFIARGISANVTRKVRSAPRTNDERPRFESGLLARLLTGMPDIGTAENQRPRDDPSGPTRIELSSNYEASNGADSIPTPGISGRFLSFY
jgi:REP element-mobilizing transposase RayT